MKKIILTSLLLFAIIYESNAQSKNITSAAIVLDQYYKEKDKSIKAFKINEAREYIDKAYINENTSNKPKMWMYRAKIYLVLALNYDSIDSDAIFKATESHLKCMQPHPKKKNKILIYKKWPKEEVLTGLIQCGDKLFRLAVSEYTSKNYISSLKHYKAIFDILPFDEDNLLKRGNITKETILYNSFFSSMKMNDNIKSKDFLQQLMNMNFNEPKIFIYMSNIYLEEKDMQKSLEYLQIGRELFEDDNDLIKEEIRLYTLLGRTSELIEKLTQAIASDPENEIYYVIRGTCYQNSDDLIKSINDYISALEINPNQLTALNNISSCYLMRAEPIVDKLNKLNINQISLEKKYKNEIKQIRLSVLPYLETYISLEPKNITILEVLAEIYYKLDMYEKSKEIKNKIENSKK